MNGAVCDPADIQKIRAEQTNNAKNFGVGVLDLQSGMVRVFPYDDTDHFVSANPQFRLAAGHDAAAAMAGFAVSQTRGFALAFDAANAAWKIVNLSHLNLADGMGLRMAQKTFADVVIALLAAGVVNPSIVN